MTEALYVLIGPFVSILLDWAIYTHLSAYLRVGVPSTPECGYRQLALGNPTALIRTFSIVAGGLAGGLAFALKIPALWLISVGMFALAHTVLYRLLYRRG